MGGDFAVYVNVSNGSIAFSPNFSTAIQGPLILPQGSQPLVDVYFVEETGNPANPWTYLDPVDYVGPRIQLAQTNQSSPSILALASSFTYNGGAQPYLETSLNLAQSEIKIALGSSPSLKCIFEVDWINSGRQLIVQCSCLISKSILSSGGSGPTPTTPQIFDPINNVFYALTAGNGVLTLNPSIVTTAPMVTVYDPNNSIYYTLTAPNGVLTLT